MVSGVAPSSRSLVPTSSTTAVGLSASTSSCSRISTPRDVSPLMPRLAIFTPGKAAAESLPLLRDRIAEEDHGALVLARSPSPSAERRSRQSVLEPVVAADGPRSGQAVVGGGNREPVGLDWRWRLRCSGGHRQPRDQQPHCENAGNTVGSTHAVEHTSLISWLDPPNAAVARGHPPSGLPSPMSSR